MLDLRTFAVTVPSLGCCFSQTPTQQGVSSLGKGQSGHRHSQPNGDRVGVRERGGAGSPERERVSLGSRGRFEQAEMGSGWRRVLPSSPCSTHVLLDPPPSPSPSAGVPTASHHLSEAPGPWVLLRSHLL